MRIISKSLREKKGGLFNRRKKTVTHQTAFGKVHMRKTKKCGVSPSKNTRKK